MKVVTHVVTRVYRLNILIGQLKIGFNRVPDQTRAVPPERFSPSFRFGLFLFLPTMVAVLATLARVASDDNTLIISEKFSDETHGFTLVGNVGILVTDNWPLLCF